MSKLADQHKNFSKWYLDVVNFADLAEYSAVKGCMVIKPYGYAVWEAIQSDLNARIKALGAENVYFPLFIPESFLEKEKKHVEGFAPQCAVVTRGGGEKLEENLYIRPTSETIMYNTFSKWIQSHRDIPLKINQWANIVRWEMRTRPFLRTTEFLWQEGHTAHAKKEEADFMMRQALKMYKDFSEEILSIPVITGYKTEKEKFAGALQTSAAEALARDGKAIQTGTSHNLGDNFAKTFNIKYLDEKGKEKYVWQTSWGVSTRLIGTIIVVHGDKKGLRLPPALAPVQAVIIPIYKGREKDKIMKKANEIKNSIEKSEIRVRLDDREEKTPGFKFNEWEVKGVPIRIELGPKDLKENSCILMRRDLNEKSVISISALEKTVLSLLPAIQKNMFNQALSFREENTREVDGYSEFKKVLKEKSGFIIHPFCGDISCEDKIQQETKATVRVIPFAGKIKNGSKCLCGKPAKLKAYFAKAY